MPGKASLYVARRPMVYAGKDLDRGQVFMLVGAVNDEKLERLGYMAPVAGRDLRYTCAECGAEFVGEAERRGHGDKRHTDRVLSPQEEDALEAREERLLEHVAPLHLDQTAATLNA